MCAPHPPSPVDDLEALIPRERAAWVATARHEGLGPEDAIDCVQDALAAFVTMRRTPDFDVPSERVAATLTVMVKNAARNRRRKHDRAKPHAPLDGALLRDEQPIADELVVRAEDGARLEACIAGLSPPQRAVVALRLFEERSGEDVARDLGIQRGHVDVLVHRAKASLRACMCDEKAPA